MRTVLIVSLIFLTGCFNSNVRKYTEEHKGVTCKIKDYKCSNSFYRDGEYVEGECTYYWICSDGQTVVDKS